MLTTKQMNNLYNYLDNTVGWLRLSPDPFNKNYNCLIHEIWDRYDRIFSSKELSNFEKKIFLKRMFSRKEGESKFPLFLCNL